MKGRERCRLHGGKTPKGKTGGAANGNHKHGLYSAHLSDEERAAWDSLPLGGVDDELRMCRVLLSRALALEAEIAIDPNNVTYLAGFELAEIRRSLDGGRMSADTTSRRPDVMARINTLLGRIGSLEKLRADLIAGTDGDTGLDQARRIKNALDAIEDAVIDQGEPETGREESQ
ncbi:hypothetical protein N825_28900 [Skermanella stibiiresistens SB22]|uniref:Uncharacterized protein n=2 Tax=Skermanella TaxID=204447 RepID=W9GXT8_9PROT|nr:hypothetical protein N825_28900 [Skermanella stibiiresistens SB22]